MPAHRHPGESDADYVERLMNAGADLPPGRYELDRTVHLRAQANADNTVGE